MSQNYKDTLNLPRTDFPMKADRKSTRLNSSHLVISYAVFCLKKKKSIFAQRPTFLQSRQNQKSPLNACLTRRIPTPCVADMSVMSGRLRAIIRIDPSHSMCLY